MVHIQTAKLNNRELQNLFRNILFLKNEFD